MTTTRHARALLDLLALVALCGCAALAGCADGRAHLGGDAGPAADASGAIPDATPPGDAAATPMDTGMAVPSVTPRSPCGNARCWTAPSLPGSCGGRALSEDFATGRYDAHRVAVSVRAGVPLELTLEVTRGAFEPALLLLSPDGVTVYDGAFGVATAGLEIVPLDPGRGARAAAVSVMATTDLELHAFVTSWSTVESGFTSAMPTDAAYVLTAQSDCPAGATLCPIAPESITSFGSGYFRRTESSDPSSPMYSPYKRDTRAEHQGYDVYARLGTPLVAVASGTIVSAVTAPAADDLCGLSVNLAADSGVTFRYCHLERVDVTSGRVTTGQQLGVVGASGNAHSPHLHFVYLDAPDVAGVGSAYRSDLVNGFIDSHCR